MRKATSLILALVIVTLLSGSVGVSCAPAAPAKIIELNMTSALTQEASQSASMIAWGKELEKRTNGQVKIGQATWAGAVLKPTNSFQGLGQGMVDVAQLAVAWVPTEMPLSFALTPAFRDDGAAMNMLMMELIKTIPEIEAEWTKQNIKVIGYQNGADGILISNFEINSLSDLKAKRFRAVGSLADVMGNLGVVPLNIGAADVYTAVQKGTIDGCSGFPAYSLISNKMVEVAKQVTNYRWGCYAMWTVVGMNLDKYNSLPDSAKKVIADIAPIITQTEAKVTEDMGFAGLKACRQQGVKIVQLSEADAKMWQQTANVPAVYEKYLVAAEQKGYKDTRKYMDQALKFLDDYNRKNPRPTLFERFFELEKQGKI